MGSSLIYSTYLGGNGFDVGNDIAVDNIGNAFIVGETGSPDFSTTPNAFQTIFGGPIFYFGPEDVFVTKINPTGELLFSTYIGGRSDDRGFGIVVDEDGNSYVTGYSKNPGYSPPLYPTTPDAYGTSYNLSEDIFVTKLNSEGSELVYSTLIGGDNTDYGQRYRIKFYKECLNNW